MNAFTLIFVAVFLVPFFAVGFWLLDHSLAEYAKGSLV